MGYLKWVKSKCQEYYNNQVEVKTRMEKDKGKEPSKFEQAVGFGIGIGLILVIFYMLYKNNDWTFWGDFERKEYIPYTHNNDFLLINKKNGKTYKLEIIETEESTLYKYVYLNRPKSKTFSASNKDPLGILNYNNTKSLTTKNGTKYRVLNNK